MSKRKIAGRALVLAFLWALIPAPVFAQGKFPTLPPERPWWLILEEGKKAFREARYGAALALFEDARSERRKRYTTMENNFISLLSIHEVRRFGDLLESIEQYIEDHRQFDAAAALSDVFYRVGRDAVANSAKKALSLLNKLKEYPEAEYWIGEVYRLEGEYPIALQQYQKAIDVLVETESTLQPVALRYKIAGIHRDLQNYTQMEAVMDTILQEDSLWNQNSRFMRSAMARTLGNQGINHFLTLYRYKNAATERAHRIMGEFCYKSGRYNLAEAHLTFAMTGHNTVLIEEALRSRFDFAFTTLDALMSETERRQDLQHYKLDVDYYRTLYYLAASLYANGKTSSAQEIWTFLAGQREGGEWQRSAQNQLRAPFVEKALKTP